MHRFARPTVIGVLGAAILGLALIPLANSSTASPRGASDTAAELAACVRALRADLPALSYQAGVVRCVRPTRVETRSDVRWSTCKGGGAPAPGERCETGTAGVELRSTDVDRELRRGAKGYPHGAERWHLYGQGTARCTRAIHGLPAGDPRARRSAAGRIEHVDFLMLWPAGAPGGTIAIGVHPGWSNWLKTARPADAIELFVTPACGPLAGALLPFPAVLPPFARLAVSTLLDPAGVSTSARARYVRRDFDGLDAMQRPVGAPLVVRVSARTTATLEVDSRRTIE